jgi:conjugal transfer pilus assembly protein TraW
VRISKIYRIVLQPESPSMRILVRPLLLLVACTAFPAISADMGVVGPTYEVAEPDLIEVIQSRLKQMQMSGELARKQIDYRDKVVGGIEAPKAIVGIKATQTPRTFYFDPSWTLDRDIRNAEGVVLFARGLKVNPLDHVSLSHILLFFDGRDRRQVAFAKTRLDVSSGQSKPILVGGEPLKLMRAWKRSVFYDQGGALVRRLGIRQVPAIVSQDG